MTAFAKISFMESLKANLIIFVFILVAVALGYWAVMSLRTNSAEIALQHIPEDVGPMVTSTPDVEPEPSPATPDPVTPEPSSSTPTPNVSTNPPTQAGEHAGLIDDLQDLIDDNILMKKGSRGTRVGTVQKFLIEYGINMDADNDHGDTTVNAGKKFQSEQKHSADGQAGPGTFEKMIDWLEAN